MTILMDLSELKPVLIAGPTASGKSALALRIAAKSGGEIVNADAMQVFANWRVLTARPTRDEEAIATHHLYGHVAGDFAYSTGHWLRDVEALLKQNIRPIIVGGTGLYFTALTEGLADIPPVPKVIRAQANALIENDGHRRLLADLDDDTRSRIDQNNPVRVQRAWEVLRATGKSIAQWQDETPPPLLPLHDVEAIVIDADKDWLSSRIERRFDSMVANGALEEAEGNLKNWDPMHASAKAIGAKELIEHVQGKISLADASKRAKIATRQYAKRQRTWIRSKMKDWQVVQYP